MTPMQIRCPELTSGQIAEWMQGALPRPSTRRVSYEPLVRQPTPYHHPGFDFKKTRDALGRARNKSDVHTIKPLQRLRRNQGAVNEGLIDAFSALIAVNKQMAREIAGLSTDVATLRQRLAEQEARLLPEENAEQR
jgi:hypothetical protein